MSIADLMRSLVAGGDQSLLVIGLIPVAVGLLSWGLLKLGQERISQLVANAGIALGLMALLVMICSLIWSTTQKGMSVVEDVGILWLVAPVYLVVAGFFVEHWMHPGRQEGIRDRVRGALLIVIVLAVLYWLLSRMRVWMLVHTGVFGLILFIGALVGLLYFLVRKAV